MSYSENYRRNLFGRCSDGSYSSSGYTIGDGITWEERTRTLKDIIYSGKYPCLVKARTSDVKKFCKKDGRTSQDEVLHVLETRRHKMVVAEKQKWERHSGEFLPTGWFEVLPDNGQPVRYFRTINAIVAIRPKRFLVRTSIPGYHLGNRSQCWEGREIRPGEVLSIGSIYMDLKRAKIKTILKQIFTSDIDSGKKEQDLKYLQCFDIEDREIMIPLITTGVFSPVGDASSPNYEAVYSLHDIISVFDLPIKVQQIHTDSSMYDRVPSPILLLEQLKDTEGVLMAKHPYVEGLSETFEIPIECDFTVIREKETKRTSLFTDVIPKDGIPKDDIDQDLATTIQIHLPVRVKDNAGIFDKLSVRAKNGKKVISDKLSVRAKARQERARSKALKAEGFFSSRLNKCNTKVYDSLTNRTVENDTSNRDSDRNSKEPANRDIGDRDFTEKQAANIENGYSISANRTTIQERDLLPFPVKNRHPRKIPKSGKEHHDEELPIAPNPPPIKQSVREKHINDEPECVNDGYMIPCRLKELNESQGNGDFDISVRHKPATAPRDSLRYTRAKSGKEHHDEELPIAPNPPPIKQSVREKHIYDVPECVNDGYMIPCRLKELNESQVNGDFDISVRHKPATAPRDSLRYTRAKSGKEHHDEELPIAPNPPPIKQSVREKHIYDVPECVNDGYMIPGRFKELNESQVNGDFDISVRHKPATAPRDSLRYTRAKSGKEHHDEELPIAPNPPPIKQSVREKHIYDVPECVNDGYMIPGRFKELNESQVNGDFDISVRHKPATAQRDSLRYTRARKVKNGYSHLPPNFSMADLGSADAQRRNNQMMRENSRGGSRSRTHDIDEIIRFYDDSALESKSLSSSAKLKSRSQKNLNLGFNAIKLSHNVKKRPTAMEVFNFSDSMRDSDNKDSLFDYSVEADLGSAYAQRRNNQMMREIQEVEVEDERTTLMKIDGLRR